MSKNYQAQISIKEQNSIATLKKIMDATIKLKKELDKISNKPIIINAKTGSSFKNIQSQINKVAPKSKTIHFKATEDVTRTMSNVNRQVFEMSKNIKTGLQGSMKGFNASLNASLPKLQTLGNTMAAIANGSRLMNTMAKASALSGAGAGLAGAAVLKNKGNNSLNDNSKTDSFGILDRLKSMGNKIKNAGISLGKKFSKGFKDAIEESSKMIGNIKSKFSNLGINSKGIFASDGSELSNMIERQKNKLSSLGISNPLKNWSSVNQSFGEEEIFLGFTREWQGVTTKILAEGKQVFKEMGQNAKENLGKAGEWIKNKWNNNHMVQMTRYTKEAFSEMARSAISKITPIGNKIKQLSYSFAYSCERGKYFFEYFASKALISIGKIATSIKTKISNAFNTVKSAASKVASYIPQPIKNAFSKVTGFAKKAASGMTSAFKSAVPKIASAITSGLSAAFNKVASMAKGVAKGIAAAFAGAVAFGVKDMATQEQYITSMSHFISVDDAKRNGTNTISKDEAKNRADGLFDWGTDFANNTPFQNADVYSAINRMSQVFGYGEDGGDIKKMTKLAGDMAALNPSKTMQDAVEAIADLAVGETERIAA